MNSVVYHQAISFIKQNKKCQEVLGNDFQIMLCNGKMWPMKNDCSFDIIVFFMVGHETELYKIRIVELIPSADGMYISPAFKPSNLSGTNGEVRVIIIITKKINTVLVTTIE